MTEALRVVIVDDEAPARAIVREYLSEHADVVIAAECSDGFQAVKAVNELKPDLLILDVQMPKLDGFEVLEMVSRETAVIFATAFDEYALKAFQVHAVDYLLKPFSAERLAEALRYARARVGAANIIAPAALTKEARRPGALLDRIVIRDRSTVHVIPIHKIDYLEAHDDYVGVHTGGKMLLKEQTLSYYEQEFASQGFVRIHRRFLLNIDRLVRLENDVGDGKLALLSTGITLPVSRSGFNKLKELL